MVFSAEERKSRQRQANKRWRERHPEEARLQDKANNQKMEKARCPCCAELTLGR